MSDITINYKGSALTTMSSSATKTLLTEGKYLEDDIEVVYDKPASPTPSLETVSKNYTPTESQQTETVTASSGYDGLEEVDITVAAISSSYVGSGITRRDSTDLSASGATVTAPSGYYSSSASKTVASGTEGTPTATKGTVSSHSVTVTPSVTNAAGYISGGTHTGTGVSVSASELVSGTKSISSNGTNIDVTNYAAVDVSVSGGSGDGYVWQDAQGYVHLSDEQGTHVEVDALSVTQNGTYTAQTGHAYSPVTVSVSGGGGLEYETGQFTLESIASTVNIPFTNTHTVPPFFYMVVDATGTYLSTSNRNHSLVYANFERCFGEAIDVNDGTSFNYGSYISRYRVTTATSMSGGSGTLTTSDTDPTDTGAGNSRYWATETGIKADTGSTSRYWAIGRTYKWIAVWAPTT